MEPTKGICQGCGARALLVDHDTTTEPGRVLDVCHECADDVRIGLVVAAVALRYAGGSPDAVVTTARGRSPRRI